MMTERQKIARGKRIQSIGQKRPFTQEQVQLIRLNLTAKGEVMQLALLETAISTCLRASDLLALRYRTIAKDQFMLVEAFPLKQKKTGKVLTVHLRPLARQALDVYLKSLGGVEWDQRLFLFTRQHYGRLVKGWAALAHLDTRHYSTHSMRRVRPTHVHNMTKNVKVASELLGHANITHTGAYLGIDNNAAHAIAEEFDV